MTIKPGSYDVLEPVLDENNNPKWLIKTIEKISNTSTKRNTKDIIRENMELEEKSRYTLEEHGIWECQRCGAWIKSNPGMPSICYKEQGGCDRNSTFISKLKIINTDLWKLPRWKNIEVDDLDMIGLFDDSLNLTKKLLVFNEEIEYKIFVLWNFSTWKLETWDTVGFPCFIGIPNSGKSRALRIIHNIGYRAPKASGVKQAAIPRLCHYYNVTLLIDEAHNKLNPRTESGSGLIDFVKDSYKRDSVYIVCDNNDQEKIIVTKNFGFKAFAGEKTFDAGLLSRSFTFWMQKEDPEIAKLQYVDKQLNDIRTRLLNYRFKTDNPPDLGNDFELKGRIREIFESIIATGIHIGIKTDDIINFANKRIKQEESELQDTDEYEILKIIKEEQENPSKIDSPEAMETDLILNKLNWDADNKARQKLGYILKNKMGLKTKRINGIRWLYFFTEDNKNQLDRHFKRYKI